MIRLLLLLMLSCMNIYSYEPLSIRHYVETIPYSDAYYMGADLGGTNMDFGVFIIQENKPVLLISLHTKTKTITNFTQLIKDVLKYTYDNYGISIYKACMAVPGTPKAQWSLYTFRPGRYFFDVSIDDITHNSSLSTVILASDSTVISYGLEHIEPGSIIRIAGPKQGAKYEQRATLNLGTGLGSATASWDSGLGFYISHHGRAGRLEFAPINQEEFEIAQLIKKTTGNSSIYWNNMVSGFGIRDLYFVLKSMKKYHDSLCLNECDASIIFIHPEDELCTATMDIFFRLLVRFVRNYATVVFPFGGLYLAGGIVGKNAERIAATFAMEYDTCDATLQEIVQEVPIYMVTDCNVSLYGAMHYLLMQDVL